MALVLTDDLRWIPATSVVPGQGLMGFDPEPLPGQGRSSRHRAWRRVLVKSVQLAQAACYDLVFEGNVTIRAAKSRRWLMRHDEAARWQSTDQLRAGSSRVACPLRVWDTEHSRQAGYLAAAFDGEGHLTQRSSASIGGRFTTRLGFTQRMNPMLEEVTRALAAEGYTYTVNSVPRDKVHNVYVSNRSDVLRLLGSIRPARLLPKFDPDKVGSMLLSPVRLLSKTYAGEHLVPFIVTDTFTFIEEGLASGPTQP